MELGGRDCFISPLPNPGGDLSRFEETAAKTDTSVAMRWLGKTSSIGP